MKLHSEFAGKENLLRSLFNPFPLDQIDFSGNEMLGKKIHLKAEQRERGFRSDERSARILRLNAEPPSQSRPTPAMRAAVTDAYPHLLSSPEQS